MARVTMLLSKLLTATVVQEHGKSVDRISTQELKFDVSVCLCVSVCGIVAPERVPIWIVYFFV